MIFLLTISVYVLNLLSPLIINVLADDSLSAYVHPEDDFDKNMIWPDKNKYPKLFYYKQARVYNLSGYEENNQCEIIYYSNIKNNMASSTEGGFPHYGHAPYLPYAITGDGLQKFTFEIMRKIKKNETSNVGGTNESIKYYFDRDRDHGFPNFKNRKQTGYADKRIAHDEGSGHYKNSFYDPNGIKKGEWRYLGYGNAFQTITSPFFPADLPILPYKVYQTNWQIEPWHNKYPFGIEKNSEYNVIYSEIGMKNMLRFMKEYELDKYIDYGSNKILIDELKYARDNPMINTSTGKQDTPLEAQARIWTQYFSIDAVATDYSAGSISGVYITDTGVTRYMTLGIPALVAPENPNLKVASPIIEVKADGVWDNIGGLLDDEGKGRNSIVVYEYDPNIRNSDGTFGNVVGPQLVIPFAKINQGEFNATLDAGKTYLFRAFVRYYNYHPTETPRETYTPIRVKRTISFNNKTTDEFTIANDGINGTNEFHGVISPNGVDYIDKPMPANTTQRFEWIYKIPINHGGEQVSTMDFRVELAGKEADEDRSYLNDNLWTDKDDTSTIKLKINAPLPNLTVASPDFKIEDDSGVERTNIEIYEKPSINAPLKPITVNHEKDSNGFNGYINKLKRYVVRVYVNNNPRPDGGTTKTNVTANFKLCYDSQNKFGWCEGDPEVDGTYKDMTIPDSQTEYMDYEIFIKDKIGNIEVSSLKIDVKIVNGQNCHPDDNKILKDDGVSILLSLKEPEFPNMRIASKNYPFYDKDNIFRDQIEVVLEGSTVPLNPVVDKLVPGKTYKFKSYVRYYPKIKDEKGDMIDDFVELDRTYMAKVGHNIVGPSLNKKDRLAALGNNTAGERIIPNKDTTEIEELVTIPKDFNTNFKYCVSISSKHTNRDNSYEVDSYKLDDNSCVTYSIGYDQTDPNLRVTNILAFKPNSTVAINPATEKLNVGDTYRFEIHMTYENEKAPHVPTQVANILCDYDISGENPQFLPIGSLIRNSSKLRSSNYSGQKLTSGTTSIFIFNQKITQDMGKYIYVKGKVPQDYTLDNTNPADDEKTEKFNIECNDLKVESAYFTYNGSPTDTLTLNKPHALIFKIKKTGGEKLTPNVQVYYKIVDAFNQQIAGGYLVGNKTLSSPGDYQEFTINHLETQTGKLTATIIIDPPERVYHRLRGENYYNENDILKTSITSDYMDLSVSSFQVNPSLICVESGQPIPPQTISFNVQITNSNKTNSTVGNGITNVALVIRKKNSAIIKDPSTNQPVIKYLLLPPDIQAGFSIVLNDYKLDWGANEFEVEINPTDPSRSIIEASNTSSDPYLNNKKFSSINVSTCYEFEPCEVNLSTTKSNSWRETFNMMEQTGSKQSYDCSYTTESGGYVSQTCYYCNPDNKRYWSEIWNYQERFSISAFYFRSQYTVDMNGGDGWVNILGNNSVGKVRAGSGFEVRIQTNYYTDRYKMPNTYYRDMCNYQTRNPGVYPLQNVNRISVTIPEFKTSGGNAVTYRLYPITEWGAWYNSTKEFQFPLRSAFGIEMNRKIYVNENAKIGSKINFKIISRPFQPYYQYSDIPVKPLQDCINAQIEVVDGTKVRTHVVD